jgi:HK97 family phage prohead protease
MTTKEIDITKKQTKQIALANVKAINEGNGGFSGYASVFNVKDSYGEATVAGCFKESLQSFIDDGWIAEGHKWGEMGFGYIKNAYEDGYGLMIEVEYHSDAESQRIRTKINERIAAKKSVKLSIGYYLKEWKWLEEESTLLLTRVDLKEVSVVNVPALLSATVMTAKNFAELSFEEHATLAAQATTTFTSRVKSRIEVREGERKAGAELSAQNVTLIDTVTGAIDTLQEANNALKELADRNRKSGLESDPAPSPEASEKGDDTPSTDALFRQFHERKSQFIEMEVYP